MKPTRLGDRAKRGRHSLVLSSLVARPDGLERSLCRDRLLNTWRRKELERGRGNRHSTWGMIITSPPFQRRTSSFSLSRERVSAFSNSRVTFHHTYRYSSTADFFLFSLRSIVPLLCSLPLHSAFFLRLWSSTQLGNRALRQIAERENAKYLWPGLCKTRWTRASFRANCSYRVERRVYSLVYGTEDFVTRLNDWRMEDRSDHDIIEW